MKRLTIFLILKLIFMINFVSWSNVFADNHNIYQTLEQIQKDIKTLEKAVYSSSVEISGESLNTIIWKIPLRMC